MPNDYDDYDKQEDASGSFPRRYYECESRESLMTAKHMVHKLVHEKGS